MKGEYVMPAINEIISKLPLDKLTQNRVLIVVVLILIIVLIIALRKTDSIDFEDKHSVIEESKVGNIKNSNNSKSIKIKFEGSDIKKSEIGCITNDREKK